MDPTDASPLYPRTNAKVIAFWESYFLRFDPQAQPFVES
jgi:hypothetical protein